MFSLKNPRSFLCFNVRLFFFVLDPLFFFFCLCRVYFYFHVNISSLLSNIYLFFLVLDFFSLFFLFFLSIFFLTFCCYMVYCYINLFPTYYKFVFFLQSLIQLNVLFVDFYFIFSSIIVIIYWLAGNVRNHYSDTHGRKLLLNIKYQT